jgi:hypothetical protein
MYRALAHPIEKPNFVNATSLADSGINLVHQRTIAVERFAVLDFHRSLPNACLQSDVPRPCRYLEVPDGWGQMTLLLSGVVASCTSLISREFPDLWPRGSEISFCHTIHIVEAILQNASPNQCYASVNLY